METWNLAALFAHEDDPTPALPAVFALPPAFPARVGTGESVTAATGTPIETWDLTALLLLDEPAEMTVVALA